jgi:toxin ParE1/3/4
VKVIWTHHAISDLDQIADFIEQDHPEAADRVFTRIFTAVMSLASMPQRGRPGVASGTRELVFPPWPYIAVYRVTGNEVYVVRIRHAAQKPTPGN